jgi:hypothetical protein
MPVVTLREKVYPPFSPKMFEPTFTSLCEGLHVRIGITGKTSRGWLQVDVSGEDETAALSFLNQRIGLAPVYAHTLKRWSTIKGRIVAPDKSRTGLYVDVGILSPQIVDAAIELRTLQSQVADGKKLPLRRLVELFCFHENLPLEVKMIGSLDPERKCMAARLSEAHLSHVAEWMQVYLDRLIVLGARLSDVGDAIKQSGHARDVIKVESLGLLEHCIECKLGTDALGLIPKLGSFLSTATLAPFSPRRIRQSISGLFE